MSMSTWQKSSYCAEGSNCVEIRQGRARSVQLRESTEADRILTVTPSRLGALLRAVRADGGPAR